MSHNTPSIQTLLNSEGQLTDLLEGLIYIAKEEDPLFTLESFDTAWQQLHKRLHIPNSDPLFTKVARLNLHFFETSHEVQILHCKVTYHSFTRIQAFEVDK